MFNHFGQTHDGVTSINVFGVGEAWTREGDARLDQHYRAQYVSYVAKRWVNLRLDFLSLAIATMTELYVAAFYEVS